MNQWTWLLDLILCLHPVLYPVFASVSFKPIALTSPSRGFTVTTRTPPDDFIDTANSNYAQQPSLEAWYFLMLLIFHWYFMSQWGKLEPTCDWRRWWRRYQVQDLFPILRNPPGWDELPACRTSSHASIQLHCALSFGSSWRVNWGFEKDHVIMSVSAWNFWMYLISDVRSSLKPKSSRIHLQCFPCFPCFASYGFWKPSSSCRRRSCPVNLHFGRVWAFSILERHETNETSWHWGVKKPEMQLQIASHDIHVHPMFIESPWPTGQPSYHRTWLFHIRSDDIRWIVQTVKIITSLCY